MSHLDKTFPQISTNYKNVTTTEERNTVKLEPLSMQSCQHWWCSGRSCRSCGLCRSVLDCLETAISSVTLPRNINCASDLSNVSKYVKIHQNTQFSGIRVIDVPGHQWSQSHLQNYESTRLTWLHCLFISSSPHVLSTWTPWPSQLPPWKSRLHQEPGALSYEWTTHCTANSQSYIQEQLLTMGNGFVNLCHLLRMDLLIAGDIPILRG